MPTTSQTQRDFLSSAHFSSRLDCLALTLEEVVHIRNVLTKADLEALPLDLTIKEDVAKGKICFLCMKTRFGFFGPRGTNCRLCKRTVCKKCVTKMRIPTEHFSNIPVQMLTPQALSPRDEEDDAVSLPRSILARLTELPLPGTSSGSGTEQQQRRSGSGMSGTQQPNRRSSMSGSVGSAPSSPTLSSRCSGEGGSGGSGPTSLPPTQPPHAPYVSEAIKKKQKQRSRTHHPNTNTSSTASTTTTTATTEEQLRGELMAVCGDCKAMVLHILASIKLRRQQHQQQYQQQQQQQQQQQFENESPRHNLHLNLNPVYH
ncbi:hypothetical protein Pcinc_041814 [Petrolisthes cinctipes]|uniref:Protein spire n=1 Tax=Petrolisthes cinctipes TaxID=88211 RepID=A0AAE1EHZ4_PETCI|nr:hypothetical protein Pcinc_041814 [Petrolisthes cinctipes]KAK3851548.1 hypothetical protein Pcinc_041814 [Petrolisthes cinctipes]KAK3851550.1 hypothetical protein Pcinc_041814 [Petrolisthes cinctipes]